MRKRSVLAYAAAGVSGAALAGFGLGIGRNAWRHAKKNYLAIMVLIAMFASLSLPFLGGRNLIRGYPQRSPVWVLTGCAESLALVVLGTAIAFGLTLVAIAMLSDQPQAATGAMAIVVAASFTAAALALGLVVGLFQRPGRLRRFAIAEANHEFLEDLGFRETGEQEITHYDGEGNALRLLERATDAMVFLAVGRRSKRAYIELDKNGLMTGYSGVIGIDNPRVYKAA